MHETQNEINSTNMSKEDEQFLNCQWLNPNTDTSPNNTFTSMTPAIYYPKSPTEAVGKTLRYKSIIVSKQIKTLSRKTFKQFEF